MRPDYVIDACRVGHRRLVGAMAPLSAEELQSPSLLPGYTRRHVVAHVINKTKAHIWLFGGPPAGEVRRLHPDGYDADRAAEAGAARSTGELLTDLAQSFEQLEAAWDTLTDGMWTQAGIMTAGLRTMPEIVVHHLRNVEVHSVDLDIGYRPSDWPAVFVETELPKRLNALPHRAEHVDLLAWLLGRAPAPDLGPW
ncbi:MAG: hypothetical protein AMXMBFR46_00600 [Acidimicrobiia bacterium]